jgi:hypothetical protein
MPPDYVDDAALPNDAVLWRAINPLHIKPDLTVMSAAYSTDGLSVYVLAETSPGELAAKFPGWPFQAFTAKVARDVGCIIHKAPDDAGDTSHREIRRAANPVAQLRKEAVKIRDVAAWVQHDDIPVPQAPPPPAVPGG